MSAIEWTCLLACLLAGAGTSAWMWLTAGETRELEAHTDPGLLRAIDRHQHALAVSPLRALPKALVGPEPWPLQRSAL